MNNIKTVIGIGLSAILINNASAIVVMPEMTTVVPVSSTDMTRLKCVHGQISAVDYVAGTGLIHTTHKNNKNTIINFQQLDDGMERKIISAKVSFGIICADEYYQLVLDPQPMETQVIQLQLPELKITAKSNKTSNENKSNEQVLLDLIKQSRAQSFGQNLDLDEKIYLGDLQIQLLNETNVAGTNYQIKRFVITSNKEVGLSEKDFINTKLGFGNIRAISLDDQQLSKTKNYTYLHLILDRGN